MKDWWLYKGIHEPHDGIDALPDPPSWRRFSKAEPESTAESTMTEEEEQRLREKAYGFQIDEDEIDVINAALFLRRPLLVTGKPGCGKSTMAYAVAYELKLGPVLQWPITTNVTLQNGLYHYDAIGRLQQASLTSHTSNVVPDIGEYLRLGPLGTALLPRKRPRVLLIDEIDKSDVDLPNNLLHIFEEGEYEIPELTRIAKQSERVAVMPYDSNDEAKRVVIRGGHVRCSAFPFVVLTSNEEREFPPAFLRRCLRLEMKQPNEEKLIKIVEARLGPDVLPQARNLIENFMAQRASGDQATDQLLNAIYMITQPYVSKSDTQKLREALLRPLTNEAFDES
jgi:MoxR-like ATPase